MRIMKGISMNTQLNPYISFNGNAKEAMEFYQSALGGELEMTTFKDGGGSQSPEDEQKIMHAMLKTQNDMAMMGADSPLGVPYTPGTNISISLSGDNEVELTGYYEKLSAGGVIAEPLKKAPWGDTFGMFTDKFGIFWMINISGSQN